MKSRNRLKKFFSKLGYYKICNKFAANFLIFTIAIYQMMLSPLFGQCCRYQPTCSNYAIQAIKKFGVTKGCIVAIIRIVKCNPFSRGGYDPVL